MSTIYEVPTNELIEKVEDQLKNYEQIKAPEWAAYVKTGHFRQRQPTRADWWYVRSAAILRSVAKLGPVGVSKLRTKYGGKKNRGHKPEHTYRASGNIIRKALQQLEAAELIEKGVKGVHKGRVLSKKGMSLLDKTAASMKPHKAKKTTPKTAIAKPKTLEKPKTPKPEAAKEAVPKKKAPEVIEKIKESVAEKKKEGDKKAKQKGVPTTHDLAKKK